MMITLTKGNFKSFSRFVSHATPESVKTSITTKSGKVLLSPNNEWLSYALYPDEFLELKELIQGTTSLLELKSVVNEILKLN